MNLAPDMLDAFADARPHAQHCDELIARGPRPEERAESLAAFRRDVARELSQDLSELLSGAKLSVTLSEPETVSGSQVFTRIGPLAANSLLRCGKDDHTLLLSFDFNTAIAMTDRSFGGDGKLAESNESETLPRSAAMLTDQAAKIIAQVIARISFGSEHGSFDGTERSLRADVIVRSESATRLKPFAHDADCALFVLECSEVNAAGGPVTWAAILAVTSTRLEQLLPGAAEPVPLREPGSSARRPTDAPFAAIPLKLEAVLTEIDMPLSSLEQMAAGDHIPIPMPREVPLKMGQDVLAHGSVGTCDDRMAICLTRFAQDEVAA